MSHLAALDGAEPGDAAAERELDEQRALSAFVLANAGKKGVRLRPSTDPAIDAKTQRGLEIFPVKGQPLTLLLDKKTYRLVGLRDKGRSGKVRQSALSGHQRDKTLGLWLPRKQLAQGGKLVLEVKSLELNPKLSAKDIAGER